MICKNNDCVPDFDSVPLPTEITYYVCGYLKKCRLEVSPSLQLLPYDILSEVHIHPSGMAFVPFVLTLLFSWCDLPAPGVAMRLLLPGR